MRTKRLKRLVSVAVAMAFVLAMITPAVAALSPGLYYNGYFYSESYINGMTLAEKYALTQELNAADDGYYIMNLAGQDQYVLFKSYTGFSSFQPVTDTNNPLQSTYTSKADGSTVETGAPPAGVTVTAINATNGSIDVTLSEAPETAPVAADFTFTQKIDAAAATALATTDFAWAAADKKATFKFAEIAAADAEQSVVISVSYKGAAAVAANAFKVAPKPDELAVESVSAINAKTLKVEFNKAIASEDQSKVTFDVKRGTIGVSLTAKWVENGKAVELASSSNLIAGDYTVTAKGLEFKEASGTVKVEAVKATALTVKSTVLNGNTAKAKVNVSLADQYGQDMPLAKSEFTFTALNVTQGNAVTTTDFDFDATDKYFYINTTNATAFKANDVVRVTFIHKATNLQATADLTVVAGAHVDAITFGSIELPKGKDMLTADLKDVKIPYTAKDQYGNDIKLDATSGTPNVTVISSNESILKAANVSVNIVEEKVTKVKIASFEKEGKVTLTIMGLASGKTASVELDVLKKPGEVANVTVLDPEMTIAAGATGYAGLEVTDMYGKKLEAKDYANELSFVSSNPAVVVNTTPPAVETSGTNIGKVKVTVESGAAKDATTTIAINHKGKQIASFVVKAGEASKPTTVEVKADSKHKTTLAKGANTVVTFEAKDQYGSKLGDVAGFTIVCSVKDSNTNVSLTAANTALSTATVTVNADKVGSATLVVQLKDGTEVKDSKEINFTVVANVSDAGIKVSDIPTLYRDGTAGTGVEYQEAVKIETADGIALPEASIIEVTSNHPVVKVTAPTGGKGWLVEGVTGQVAKDAAGKDIDTKATITVIYNADDKTVTLDKEVTVSAAALKADTLLVVDKQQAANNTTIKNKLEASTLEVSTINVDDFAALGSYNKAFAVVKDNFGRYINAKTGATTYSDVTVTVANDQGFGSVNNKTVTIGATGQLDFSAMGSNTIAADADKASFRVIITGSGKVKTIEVNVAGKSAAQKALEALVQTKVANFAEGTPALTGASENGNHLVSWTKLSDANTDLTTGATGYEIYVITTTALAGAELNKDTAGATKVVVTNADTNSHKLTGLTAATEYKAVIYATDGTNYSKVSDVLTFTVKADE